MYSFDLNKLIKHLLPISLRKPKMIAFTTWLMEPLRYVHEQLSTYISYTNNELTSDSRVIYLEKYLNDRFDPSIRRIKIVEASAEDYPYLRTYKEANTIYFRKHNEGSSVVLRKYNERYSYYGFTIEIDNSLGDLTPDIDELKACVNARKLAGMQYDINIINS